MNSEMGVALVGLFASLSSVVFAYLAFRRSDKAEHKTDGKTEGVMFSDIGYIKACVNRVEKNLNIVDERYRDCVERIAKIEVSLTNIIKRVDEIYKVEGG